MAVRKSTKSVQAARQPEGSASIYPPGIPLWMLARILMTHLKRRAKYLPKATFDDPQWVMMLDLFIASEEGRQVSISSLSLASGVPPTTALRHIRSLVTKGLFERVPHPQDRRICLVRLSREARNQMINYLASIASGGLQFDD
jgi:DNA-binding MarR family transcriptional regulator